MGCHGFIPLYFYSCTLLHLCGCAEEGLGGTKISKETSDSKKRENHGVCGTRFPRAYSHLTRSVKAAKWKNKGEEQVRKDGSREQRGQVLQTGWMGNMQLLYRDPHDPPQEGLLGAVPGGNQSESPIEDFNCQVTHSDTL